MGFLHSFLLVVANMMICNLGIRYLNYIWRILLFFIAVKHFV